MQAKDAIAILIKLPSTIWSVLQNRKYNIYRMCWDSGWTYDKQNISPGDIELQSANAAEKTHDDVG